MTSSNWQNIDIHGHAIISNKNEEWCDHGTPCYHKIKRGRNAHEFQRINFEDFCMKCTPL